MKALSTLRLSKPSIIIQFFIGTIVLAGLMIGQSFLIQYIIQTVSNQQWQTFMMLIVLSITYAFTMVVVYYWQNITAVRFANSITTTMRNRMMNRMRTMSLHETLSISPNTLFSTFTSQLDLVKNDCVEPLLTAIYLLCQLSFSVIAIVTINPALTTMAIILCIPMALVPVVSGTYIVRARTALTQDITALNDVTGDLLHGVTDWRLSHQIRAFVQRFYQLALRWNTSANRDGNVQKIADTFNQFFTNVLLFSIWIGGGLLVMHNSMSVPQIVAFYSLIGNISVPLIYASGIVTQLKGGIVALTTIEDTLNVTFKQHDMSNTDENDIVGITTQRDTENTNQHSVTAVNTVPTTSEEHTITYHNVVLHSAETAEDDSTHGDKLQDDSKEKRAINVTLQTNRRYLLVGTSGGGKSSLVRPLFGIDDDYIGEITFDNSNIRTLGTQISSHIGLLSQSSHIFRASIRENIRMMDEHISDDDILRICDNAAIGDWVRQQTLNYIIDNDLQSLSGGERQRILLARLLIKNYNFCVIDELTSGLDPRTAHNVESTIFEKIKGFIYITHHVSSEVLHNVDNVIIVNNSTIHSMNTPQESLDDLLQYGIIDQQTAEQYTADLQQ